ncbi:MAG TPA: hypothetical protein VGU69_12500 [Rhizomicrobium sp.]|nr:hypothetical protein [Rhizomicrobium sp.]
MAVDRTIRYLSALSGASTSRVLNLASIAVANAENPDHRAKPFFTSPVINSSILLKHRVRSDETYLFADERPVATKIIVPFDIKDLRSGGRSFFIDQRGFLDTLRDIGNYGDHSVERDLEVLRITAQLPSLDPFLLREHMRAHSIDAAECYFAISPADQQRMYEFVSGEVRRLIALATGSGSAGGSTSKMVAALLSSEVDEKLEPLRLTLMMTAEDFREGVFSWRGFLYYKWNMEKLWPEIVSVLKEIKAVSPIGALDSERRTFLNSSKQNIIRKVHEGGQSVKKILNVYDAAYDDLVKNQAPATFRDFLLSAPHLFLELGDKMGAISHIVSFWRFRFPPKSRLSVDAEELTNIFTDFSSSFGVSPNEGSQAA